jgi:hypothetical protein
MTLPSGRTLSWSRQVHVPSNPMGRSQAARDGETADQGDGETGVLYDQSRRTHQIGDAPVKAVNEEDALTRPGRTPVVHPSRPGSLGPRLT